MPNNKLPHLTAVYLLRQIWSNKEGWPVGNLVSRVIKGWKLRLNILFTKFWTAKQEILQLTYIHIKVAYHHYFPVN